MKDAKLSTWLQKYFLLLPRQQKGIVTLSTLIIIIQLLHFSFEPAPFEYSSEQKAELKKDVDVFLASLKKRSTKESEANKLRQAEKLKAKYDSLILFAFNPNAATEEQFLQLGLTDKQYRIINNYRVKGGVFRTKDDLGKMYGLSPVQFAFLRPFIQLPEQRKQKAPNWETKEKTKKKEFEPFTFDPNQASQEDFQRLGFSEKQAKIILKYRNKSSGFKTKEDFKKVFVVSDKHFQKLEPYIRITKALEAIKAKKKVLSVELNSATEEELVKIKGVGAYYADHIIRYRNRLGGFVSTEQLHEIQKFRPGSVEKFIDQVKADKTQITPIFINSVSRERMIKHPYIGYKVAIAILKRRHSIGFFTSLDQLVSEEILEEDQLRRLRPYLRVK